MHWDELYRFPQATGALSPATTEIGPFSGPLNHWTFPCCGYFGCFMCYLGHFKRPEERDRIHCNVYPELGRPLSIGMPNKCKHTTLETRCQIYVWEGFYFTSNPRKAVFEDLHHCYFQHSCRSLQTPRVLTVGVNHCVGVELASHVFSEKWLAQN